MGSNGKKSQVIVCTIAALTLFAATSAQAAEEHLYDPVLSLTGSTAVSAEDSVPDPGPNHPAKGFEAPCGAATDRHGYVYVATPATNNDGEGPDGRIDVFDSEGRFVVEIPDGFQPCRLAVDSEGNLYVTEIDSHGGGFSGPFHVAIYEPDSFPPTETTSYSLANSIAFSGVGNCTRAASVSIDPSDDHLYIGHSCQIEEYGSAAEGSTLIDEDVALPAPGRSFTHAAVYGANQDIYVTTVPHQGTPLNKVFVLDGTDGHVKCEIDGVPASEGEGFEPFDFGLGATPAVDQSNGDLYVYNMHKGAIDQFAVEGEECGYVGRLPEDPPALKSLVPMGEIVVDAPLVEGEAGYDSPNEGYVYVTSGTKASNSHLFAFEPKLIGPPQIRNQATGGVTETEAVLKAEVNPKGLETSYRFEYTSEADFEETGYVNATSVPVPDAALSPGGAFVSVSEPISDLDPDTAYRFRLLASNCEDEEAEPVCLTVGEGNPGGEGEDARFSTFPLTPTDLPDERAYELVTPADTNSHIPTMGTLGAGFGGGGFSTVMASPDGESLVFGTVSGSLPGIGGGGYQDTFESQRNPLGGWQSHFTGLSGVQAAKPVPGGISPDHLYAFWTAEGANGSLANPNTGATGGRTTYLRVPAGTEPSPNCAPAAEPEGRFELIGCGSLGFEPRAIGRWIGPGGDHVIFENKPNNSAIAQQLEPCGSPTGKPTIYDRTPGGETRCVSLLPGDVTPPGGVFYRGVSADGSTVAFEADTLYVRRDNATTVDGVPQALIDEPLQCDAGSKLAGATPSYQWLRNATPIGGATSSSYTPVAEDTATLLQCRASAANAEGASTDVSSPLLVEQPISGMAPPRLSGSLPELPANPTPGTDLACETGTWSANPSFSFQWYRNATPIAGAEASEYEVQAADEHTLLQCSIAATSGGATAIAFSGAREVDVPKPPSLSGGPPTIANVSNPGEAPLEGDQLSCSEGTWENSPTISFQWLRNATPIGGATSSEYTVAAADASASLQCRVSATNADGTEQRMSAPALVGPPPGTAPPQLQDAAGLSGVTAVGNTLTCSEGSWQNSPTFAFQWLRNGTPIGGETASTHALTAADRETVVQCMVTATNAGGSVIALSAARYVNQKPIVTASAPGLPSTFGGLSRDGSRLFYLLGGDIFALDIEAEEPIQIGSGGDSTLVNVSADGSHVYFVSPVVLTEEEENGHGAKAQAGEENLYAWDGAAVRYIATVSALDLGGAAQGLGKWVSDVLSPDPGGLIGLANDASRTTPDGTVLVFQSSEDLTGYEGDGHIQIFRYDATAELGEGLSCLSCNPTGAPAVSDARLESEASTQSQTNPIPPVNAIAQIANVTEDGKRVFFQSADRLVTHDIDGLQDVYGWRAQGETGCKRVAGCLALISGGRSSEDDYLYAMTPDGSDVFFLSGDSLVAQDPDKTPSVYDARVGGGFPPPQAPPGDCLGEACQPAVQAPDDATPATSSHVGPGNPKQATKSRCPKGKRKVRRAGKTRCVKRQTKKAQRKRHNDRRVAR